MKQRKPSFTQHALSRMKQRGIPESLIREVIIRGTRTIHLSRHSVEHRLKNILGIRGVNLVVITDPDDKVITSYLEKIRTRIRE